MLGLMVEEPSCEEANCQYLQKHRLYSVHRESERSVRLKRVEEEDNRRLRERPWYWPCSALKKRQLVGTYFEWPAM